MEERSQDSGWQGRSGGSTQGAQGGGLPPKPVTSKTLDLGYGSDSSSGSDIDPLRDAVSSKLPVGAAEAATQDMDVDMPDVDAEHSEAATDPPIEVSLSISYCSRRTN